MSKSVAIATALIVTIVSVAWATGVESRPTSNRQPASSSGQSAGLRLRPGLSALGVDAISIPHMLSYQGKLTDTAGRPVPNGLYAVTFSLYAESTGGTAFWAELQDVQIRGGLFSVQLGAVTPLTSLPEDGNCYLEMQVHPDPVMTPRIRIASAAYAYLTRKADTADYALAGGMQNTWVRGSPDSVLFTASELGLAKGNAGNVLIGNGCFSHVNLGAACTTGMTSQDYSNCAIGGGHGNHAGGANSVIAGGFHDAATGTSSAVVGGSNNTASGNVSFAGGGIYNTAAGSGSIVAGGENNYAEGNWGGVLSGLGDSAHGGSSVVCGGGSNVTDNVYAGICAGSHNHVSGGSSFIGGGTGCLASGTYSAIPAGYDDTTAAMHSFAAGQHSVVPSSYSNSAAFNGQTADQTNELRCDHLHSNSIAFALDDPLDPDGTTMNQFAVGSPEIVLSFRGSAVIGSDGRVVAELPRYFDALCRNPTVQLTGVGSSDVYVAADVSGNSFSIGGRPGTKVYWAVTGERKDQLAEITRILTPIEQRRTDALKGRSISDASLAGSMDELQRLGCGGHFSFRTAAGKRRYEDMQKILRESEQGKQGVEK